MGTIKDRVRNPECKLCDLHKTAEYICLIGTGPSQPDILGVGEAPGQREDDSGRAFVGKAGQRLNLILQHVGLSRERDIFICNAVKCRPPENRKPTVREVKACRCYLEKEIELLKPKMIVCFGRVAADSVVGQGLSVEDQRRRIFKWGGTPVVVTYHPSIIMHRGSKFGVVIAEDIEWGIKRIIEGEPEEEDPFFYTTDDVLLKDYLRTSTFWSLDVETNNTLEFMDPSMRLVSAAVSPAKNVAIVKLGEEAAVSLCREVLSNPKNVVCGHNIKADLRWLRRRGIKRSQIQAKILDTMVLASLDDENYPNRKLQHLAMIHLGAKPWKDQAEEVGPAGLKEEDLIKYNGKDVIWTRRLAKFFLKRIDKQNLWKSLNIDMETIKVLTEIELDGIQLDRSIFYDLVQAYEKKLKKLRSKLPIKNPESTEQVSDYIFNALNLVPLPEEKPGKRGKYSTREEVLIKMEEEDNSGFIKRLLRYRMYATRKKMFLDGLDGESGILPFIDYRGRIHPTFNVAKVAKGGGDKDSDGGTTSGRTSCKDPNLQQWPREQEDIRRELNIKRMVISRWEGGEIGEADFRQGEVFLAANESGDKAMLGVLAKGGDFHQQAAADTLHDGETEKVTKFERKAAKAVVFGKIYRAGINKIMRALNLPYETAEHWFNTFTRRFKGLEVFMKDRESIILEQKWIRNSAGRIRHLPGASKFTAEGREMIRSGCNMLIQGLLGDIAKWGMVRFYWALKSEGLKTRVLGIIHDAILFDIYPGERNRAVYLVARELEAAQHDICKLKISLTVDVSVGPNWLDQKKLKREEYDGKSTGAKEIQHADEPGQTEGKKSAQTAQQIMEGTWQEKLIWKAA